ncbi:hypothetical protein GCM10025331_61330 [Actinoplanes utahensis]|nr:hypothetical protein Aut01nite_85140 [Actinoplanes utahensis]
MQVHVHSHELATPVWTMPQRPPERPISRIRVTIVASIRGTHALGYEPAPRPGSATHLPCDAVTCTNMIKNGRRHRDIQMLPPGVTSE